MNSEKFCIITQPRTGSEFLATLLSTHPEIMCHRELYNRNHIVHELPAYYKHEINDFSLREDHPILFLKKIFSLSLHIFPEKTKIGFKIFLTHNKTVLDYLIDRDWKLILLERENKLAQYTSLLIAERTQKWNSFYKEESREQTLISVDLKLYEEFLHKEMKLYQDIYLALLGREGVLKIKTEQISAKIRDILTFLEADPNCILTPQRGRQNSRELSKRIKNWDEISKYLQQKGLMHWAIA